MFPYKWTNSIGKAKHTYLVKAIQSHAHNCSCIHYCTCQVKDQGYCASSWAFSAVGAVEGQLFKNKGKSEPLSEQQLIDCSWSFGNAGCNGGHMIFSFRYIMNNDGICKEISYPYLGYVSVYYFSACHSVFLSMKLFCILRFGTACLSTAQHLPLWQAIHV